ncbi:MAG: PQQ-binding-like beta-propeller repeat protein [Limisphaerales bacterium]
MKPCLLLPVLLATACAAVAAPWSNFRGPNFDGSSPEKNLPATFSRTENVAWSAAMPGPSAATPAVWGDRVFVSSTDAAERSVVALAFDRKTGKELWRHKVADGDRRDDRSNFASPSPVTDGQHVWYFYGTGQLVCYTVAGQEVWRRDIQKDHGEFAFLWTFSTSPLLHGGRLYLQVLQRNTPVQGRGFEDKPNESYLLALDPKTGRDLWRHVRPAQAREESLEAFSTPTPFTHNGRAELLVTGGDDITGHDPATGRELWRWGTWNPERITHWRLVPSPVAGSGVVLACGPKGAPIFAVKAGQSGTLTDAAIAWKSPVRELTTDVSTPAFYDGHFFVVNSDRRLVFKVRPADGGVVWQGELPGRAKVEGSPSLADGKLYVMSHSGDVFVVGAGGEFKVLHTAAMGEPGDRDLRAGVAVAEGQLFVRTASKLFAIGKN